MAENIPQNLIRTIPAEENFMKKNLFRMGALSKMLCTAAAVLAATSVSYGQTDKSDTVKVRRLEKVIISDSRVSNKAPLTTSTVGRAELGEARGSVALPFMLETQPSVVASGENGTVGATSIRIRGVDASRINVNINGITLNDAESQEVFWYNIPNLGGMAQNLQIQRGVGASTGGSPAFGAAINMQTLNASSKPYGEVDFGLGSWATRQYSVTAGTGIGKRGISLDVAASGLNSDGFLRGGQTEQRSFFGNLSWYGDKTIVKLLAIVGEQHTGITWNGASAEDLDADPTYNDAGMFHLDGKTLYYDNETDNYWQQHYQLYVSHLLSDRWSINGALDFTHGEGYYEQYKEGKKYSKYGLSFAGTSDFITRKNLDNNAYMANLNVRRTDSRSTVSFGDNFLLYDGEHFGSVIWCRDSAFAPAEWYRNYGDKIDNTVYAKGTYDFSSSLNGYADIQLRYINYKVYGFADDLFDMDFDENYLFFNPKVGLNYRIDDNQRTYFVAGLMGREPRRSDIKDAIGNGDTIRAEHMLDIELGYQIQKPRWNFSINGYAMLYKDQLTPSGDISSSGYALMENVEKSYRVGVELTGGVKATDWLRFDANVTLSLNRALDFTFADFNDGDSITMVVSGTDTSWTSLNVTKNTPLSFSPSVVGSAIATFTPFKNAKIQLIGKYVGKQYIDNTGREVYAIDPYFLLNLRASYTWHLQGGSELEAQLMVNNLLDHSYRLGAWVGDWYDDWSSATAVSYYHSVGYLQQPGRNFMARVVYRF